jgi:lipopolysaccharide export system protein LptC
MSHQGLLYSRIVRVLKIFLPLIAIVMLSSIFLLSRGNKSTNAIPFATFELEQRIKDQQVSKPIYTGTNEAGDDVRISAQTLKQDETLDDVAHLDAVNVLITSDAKPDVTLTSDNGTVFRNQGKVHLLGSVFVANTDGYQMTSPEAWIYDRGVKIVAHGPVNGLGPATKLQAGHMEMNRQTKGGPMQIHFTGGVSVVYDPKKRE